MSRPKSGHAVLAHLQLSNNLSSISRILGLSQYPCLGQNISLAAGTAPGLGLFGSIEMAAARAAEYYEHEKRRGVYAAGSSMALITPSWPGLLVMRASPISVLMIAPFVRMFLLM